MSDVRTGGAGAAPPRTIHDLDHTVLHGVRPLGGQVCDVHIAAGRIAHVGPSGPVPPGWACIDGSGLIMLPGLVDLHTHLREPGAEAAETIATGTRSAAAGGYTDVFAMANTDPVTDTPERVRAVADMAAVTAAARVHPVGAVTVGLGGAELAPIETMAAAGARMFSDDGKCVHDPALMREALARAASCGAVVAQHAQDPRLASDGQVNAGPAAERTGLAPWPAVAEETIIARDAVLAGENGAPLHVCHLSTRGAVEVVRWAKRRGWPVTAEVTPHHLLLTDELAALADPRFKVNPPLRDPKDVRALRDALLDGTIDAVATDHAPHTAERKRGPWCRAAFGMTGLETALPVVAKVLRDVGALDWGHLAEVMSSAPARIGGVQGIAGRPLAAGEPATFCLVDPDTRWQVDTARRHTAAENTPFTGLELTHAIVATAIEGHLTHTAPALLPPRPITPRSTNVR